VDHRLRQMDFSDDDAAPVAPVLGRPIAELEGLDAALLVGANPRKDQPLINLRLRKAALKGAKIYAINPLDYDFNYELAGRVVGAPADMLRSLAGVASAMATLKNSSLPASLKPRFGAIKPGAAEQAMAQALHQGKCASILLGTFALSHPQAATLRALAQFIAQSSGAQLGQLPEANAVGAWLAGCVPHRGVAGQPATRGRHALDMLRQPRQAYLLLGVEPEFDCLDGAAAAAAMQAAEFVVMLTAFKPSPYRTRAVEYAHVWLPLAPFTETDGSFVNIEGRSQPFAAAAAPLGESRPGWKILRMLGNLMGLPGFEHSDIEEVRQEMHQPAAAAAAPAFVPPPEDPAMTPASGQLMRLAEVPMYTVDPIVRRAPALQKTADNPKPSARLNAAQAGMLGFQGGESVQVVMAQGVARLDLVLDERVPDGCVLVPAGYPETAMLGAHGPATLKVAS
jgi:NADH-quinone oxidoreductase subunit G